MASHRMTQATWDRLVSAFRAEPDNYSRAGREAGVQRKTAKRAYERGYPGKFWGQVPIRDLIGQRMCGACAKVARLRAYLAPLRPGEVARRDLEAVLGELRTLGAAEHDHGAGETAADVERLLSQVIETPAIDALLASATLR